MELQLSLAQALDRHKSAVLTFCQDLVRIASENPPGNHYRECTDRLHLVDFGRHTPPGGGKAVPGYFLFKDDGSGTAKELLWPVEVDDGFGGDGHGSFVPSTRGDWITSDTYNIHGFQYLFMEPGKVGDTLGRYGRRRDFGISRRAALLNELASRFVANDQPIPTRAPGRPSP